MTNSGNAFSRGELMHRARTQSGLSTTALAGKLGTTARSITGYEARAQEIPEDRWRLFTLLLEHEFTRGRAELVTIVSADQQVLDVVSSDSFIGCERAKKPGHAIIWSRYVDRAGVVSTHAQEFLVAANEQVLKAAAAWTASNLERSGLDGALLQEYRWLTQRVLKAEAAHPELRKLKDRIAELSHRVDTLVDAPEDERRAALRELDAAIGSLVQQVADRSPPVNQPDEEDE